MSLTFLLNLKIVQQASSSEDSIFAQIIRRETISMVQMYYSTILLVVICTRISADPLYENSVVCLLFEDLFVLTVL